MLFDPEVDNYLFHSSCETYMLLEILHYTIQFKEIIVTVVIYNILSWTSELT